MGQDRTYLKELRKQAGLTQQEVADKIGVTKATISKYEKGQRGIKHFKELASLYGVSPSIILTGIDYQIDFSKWAKYVAQKEEERKAKEKAYWEAELLNKQTIKVMNALDKLNAAGQIRAVEWIEELAEIPKYQKSPPQADTQGGEEGSDGPQ